MTMASPMIFFRCEKAHWLDIWTSQTGLRFYPTFISSRLPRRRLQGQKFDVLNPLRPISEMRGFLHPVQAKLLKTDDAFCFKVFMKTRVHAPALSQTSRVHLRRLDPRWSMAKGIERHSVPRRT